ncbi:hypothetical protein FEM48_Zijuj09G0112800 [Ziziphus jujuba var. spinosa]|uniref:Pentatricopeptide repeat-containing protein At2g15980 n=1 Tax=Ziziphus jujuba var. spinosa TaxID=714518 RepID=A0A978USP7_ZIZJJ|nr:hypothetical protein FEM48_Zijuj09G0112800 [Ziziphus jujuba var. spinosa]
MAISILNRFLFPIPKHKPFSLSSFSSSPASDQSNSLIPTVVSVLTHHRSKSRWNYLRSIYPDGFDPTQFSQISLQLKNNPHLVLRFFLWTQTKSLCNHNLLSYSTTIHILARGRLKGQAQLLVKDSIRLHGSEGHEGEDFDLESKPLKVFESLVKTYTQCGSAPFVFDLLLKACLESKKIDPSIQIVRMLMSRGISPKVNTCNCLIRQISLCRGAHAGYAIYREVFGLDCGIGEQNVKWVSRFRPNVQTLNTLMVGFYQDGLVEKVKEIWDQMKELNCNPDGYSYSILMAAYCDEGKMDEAEDSWDEMVAKKVQPDVVAYNTMIGGFCRIGEIERAEEFFREMALNGIESTTTTYEHLINGYCKIGNVESSKLVYEDMRRKDFRPSVSTMEALVRGFCDKNRVLEALEILNGAIRHFDYCPAGKSYEILITGLCQEGKMEEALKLQAKMVGKGFKPNSEIYNAFICGYMKQGNIEVADLLRKEMVETQMCRKEG